MLIGINKYCIPYFKNCNHGTKGPNCQYCLAGSYGDAKAGTPDDCKPCKCPLGIVTNQ